MGRIYADWMKIFPEGSISPPWINLPRSGTPVKRGGAIIN